MDIGNIVATTLITGGMQAIIGLATYKLITRQDHKIDGMRARIQDLEDKKIEGILTRLQDGSLEFKEIHGEIKDHLPRPDFLTHQQRCDKRFDEIEAEQETLGEKFVPRRECAILCANLDKISSEQLRQRSYIGELTADMSAVKAMLKAITDRMNITL